MQQILFPSCHVSNTQRSTRYTHTHTSQGNRAPFATVSLLGLIGLVFAAYFPPEGAYIIWYLWVLLGTTFCYSTINVAYTSSVFSIYKFKKERVMTEGFGYIMKTFGLLLGFFFFVITLSDASANIRALQAFLGMGCFAIGLISMPVMKEAKREPGAKKSEESLRTFFKTAKEMFGVPVFQILALVNIFDGARNAQTTLIPYYLSYVSKESTDDRSFYIIIMLVGTFAPIKRVLRIFFFSPFPFSLRSNSFKEFNPYSRISISSIRYILHQNFTHNSNTMGCQEIRFQGHITNSKR